MNQALMAWHINKTQHIAIGQWSVGVTQLNGNAACFFFFQSVGVHPGQGAYQCGLAMIDVASRRSAERRVGTECVSRGNSQWCACHSKKKTDKRTAHEQEK